MLNEASNLDETVPPRPSTLALEVLYYLKTQQFVGLNSIQEDIKANKITTKFSLEPIKITFEIISLLGVRIFKNVKWSLVVKKYDSFQNISFH